MGTTPNNKNRIMKTLMIKTPMNKILKVKTVILSILNLFVLLFKYSD